MFGNCADLGFAKSAERDAILERDHDHLSFFEMTGYIGVVGMCQIQRHFTDEHPAKGIKLESRDVGHLLLVTQPLEDTRTPGIGD